MRVKWEMLFGENYRESEREKETEPQLGQYSSMEAYTLQSKAI